MADLSKLSDGDLEALSKGDLKSVSDEGLQHLHDIHSQAQDTPKSSPGIGSAILSMIGKVGKAVDTYTGAPMRAGIGAAQNADSPGDILPNAASAFGKQFGADPETAPTGKAIVEKAGVPDTAIPPISPLLVAMNMMGKHPSYSDAAGVGMDFSANPLNFAGPAAKAVGKGAEMVGSVAPKIGDIVESMGAGSMADKLTAFSNERALKAGGAMAKDFKMINDKGLADDLGSFLMDNKLVTPMATVSKVADRIEAAKDVAGKTIGHILDTSDAAAAPKIDAQSIALHLSEDPEIKSLANIPGKEGTYKQVQNYLQTLYNNGHTLSLRDAQKLRQGVDDSINFNKRVPEMAGAQPYLYKIRDTLSQTMNDAVNAIDQFGLGSVPHGTVDRLKEANAAYSKLSTLGKIADTRIGALSSNRAVSLTDTMAGLTGAALGHSPMESAVIGAGMAGANKFGRTFGPSLMATGARAGASVVQAAPAALGAASKVLPAADAILQIPTTPESAITRRIAKQRK